MTGFIIIALTLAIIVVAFLLGNKIKAQEGTIN